MFLPLNDKQFEFWRLQRSGLPNINIARSFNISKQAVSRALITMNERIEKTMLEMACANQIEVERMNAGRGILFGHSVPFNAGAIIFVSAKHGGCRCGTSTKETAVHAIDIRSALNCCGTLLMR